MKPITANAKIVTCDYVIAEDRAVMQQKTSVAFDWRLEYEVI